MTDLGADGFTLIEVMVAMGVMTILMTLGAYALWSYWRAQSLTGAANQVLTDVRDAQVRAQAEVRTYRIFFEVDDDRYTLQRLETATGPGCSTPPCWVDVETRVFEAGIDLFSTAFASTAGCLDPNASNELYFCPRGVSSGGNVLIRSTRLNQDREIVVTGLTSRAEAR